MKSQVLNDLLQNNRAWAAAVREQDPGFFAQLVDQQTPRYLWIGCSDSRVPANQIVGLPPGELFVHRNVANIVAHADLNCLSVLQFGVDVLRVQHVIVCGHYGCGGVTAAMSGDRLGLIENWLRHIQEVRHKHASMLERIQDPADQLDRMCELNVIEQVQNVCNTTVVQGAWERGQPLSVHGLIYRIDNGILLDLGLCVAGNEQLPDQYRQAIQSSPLPAAGDQR